MKHLHEIIDFKAYGWQRSKFGVDENIGVTLTYMVNQEEEIKIEYTYVEDADGVIVEKPHFDLVFEDNYIRLHEVTTFHKVQDLALTLSGNFMTKI